MGAKTITDLNLLTQTTLSSRDLILITDISAKETKNSEVSEFVSFNTSILNNISTGSLSGSFYGNLKGLSNTSSFSLTSDLSYTSSTLLFTGESNGTASYSVNNLDSNKSITSSNSISSSFSTTSSFTLISLYALNSSSNHSLYSINASSSLNSDLSISSSYLNYYGQDNGTVISSSISERSLRSKIAENFDPNLALNSQVPVGYTLTSDYSLSCYEAEKAVTASFTELSEESEYTLERLFAAVEFRVDFDNKDNIQITPLSWKNIDNIAPPKKPGPYFTDFIVKYKKQPEYPLEQLEDAMKLSLVSVGSVQLTEAAFNKNYDQNVPIYHASTFPCGLDGFVIRFNNYTVYKEETQAGWFQFALLIATGVLTGFLLGPIGFAITSTLGAVLAGLGAAALTALAELIFGSEDSSVINYNTIPLKQYLDGRLISAAVFCNVTNFTEQGPVSNLDQYINKITTSIKSAVNTAITKLKFLKSVLITDITYTGIENRKFDNVKSIAHSTDNYNLVLLESNSITNQKNFISVTDQSGENLVFKYSPRTGSINNDSVNNLNKIKYNPTSTLYYGVSKSPGKLIYESSSYINTYPIDSYNIAQNKNSGADPNDWGTWTSVPLWKTYVHSSLTSKNIVSAIGLEDNKYILITDDVFTLNSTSAVPLPIYIVDDITNLSSTITQQSSTLLPSLNAKIGITDEEWINLEKKAKASGVNIGGKDKYQITLNIIQCKLYDITKISNTEVILVGTNAVVIYGYSVGGNWNWLRVDYLVDVSSSTSTQIKKFVNYPLNQYSVKVLKNNTVIIVGDSKDNDIPNSTRRFGVTLQCVLPATRTLPQVWDWTSQVWNPINRDNKTSAITSENSSFNDICVDDNDFVFVGYNNNLSGSYYYRNYIPGESNSNIKINCCEKIDNNRFLFGGNTTTGSFLSVYQQQ